MELPSTGQRWLTNDESPWFSDSSLFGNLPPKPGLHEGLARLLNWDNSKTNPLFVLDRRQGIGKSNLVMVLND